MSRDRKIDLDSMSMLEIFQFEAESQCGVLSDGLLLLEQSPENTSVFEKLMRAAHSVKGAARIIGLADIVDIAHAMEDVFVAAQEGKCLIEREEIDNLFRGVDFLVDMSRVTADDIERWIEQHQEESSQLVHDLRELAEREKIVLPGTDASDALTGKASIDVSMLDLFKAEVETHVVIVQEALDTYTNKTISSPEIGKILQAVHSLKGVAKIVELDDIVRIAASIESFFSDKESETIDEKTIESLQEIVTFLLRLAGEESSNFSKVLSENKAVIDRFVDELDGKSFSREKLQRKKVEVSMDVPVDAKLEEPEPVDFSIRVSAEGMNRLMGLVGEMRVESRWLPSFSSKILRLKKAQDEIHRLQQRLREKFSPVLDEADTNTIISDLTDKIELSRNLFSAALLEVDDHTRRSIDISHRLYHEVIANRMRPFRDGVRPFPRLARDLCRELGKEARLVIIGDDTKVDRDVLEKIEAPLNHLLRNALDHGIETPDEREKAGKSSQATIRIEARHSFGKLNITIEDDGRGVDLEKLRAKVIKRGMVVDEVAMELNENELLEFLFLPGFTTRDSVSDVSGRGVGLDVVRSAVNEVRGIVRVSTKEGAGTIFELQLPLTLSVLRALLVEINDEAYGFPLVSIDHVLNHHKKKVREVDGNPCISFQGQEIGLISAQQIFEQDGYSFDSAGELSIVIVSDRENNNYGVIVDRFLGVRDLVVQPLDQRIGKLQDINSAAILEDGTPVLIVDVEDVVNTVNVLVSGKRLKGISQFIEANIGRNKKRILVADDSVTVREVERKMLNSRGYEVEVAVDGVDALNVLRQSPFDLIVTDVDMPRMDGIELVKVIKKDPKLKVVPIIIVSYKDRPEDYQKGLHAGADYYLTKGSFRDDTLIKAVEDLIGTADEKV